MAKPSLLGLLGPKLQGLQQQTQQGYLATLDTQLQAKTPCLSDLGELLDFAEPQQ